MEDMLLCAQMGMYGNAEETQHITGMPGFMIDALAPEVSRNAAGRGRGGRSRGGGRGGGSRGGARDGQGNGASNRKQSDRQRGSSPSRRAETDSRQRNLSTGRFSYPSNYGIVLDTSSILKLIGNEADRLHDSSRPLKHLDALIQDNRRIIIPSLALSELDHQSKEYRSSRDRNRSGFLRANTATEWIEDIQNDRDYDYRLRIETREERDKAERLAGGHRARTEDIIFEGLLNFRRYYDDKFDVMLCTEDRSLRVKARAERIQVVDAEELVHWRDERDRRNRSRSRTPPRGNDSRDAKRQRREPQDQADTRPTSVHTTRTTSQEKKGPANDLASALAEAFRQGLAAASSSSKKEGAKGKKEKQPSKQARKRARRAAKKKQAKKQDTPAKEKLSKKERRERRAKLNLEKKQRNKAKQPAVKGRDKAASKAKRAETKRGKKRSKKNKTKTKDKKSKNSKKKSKKKSKTDVSKK